jgi:hypothetical protein
MEKGGIDLQTCGNDAVRARHRAGSISESKGQEFDNDRYELARVGKQQVLKVRDPQSAVFSFLTMLATLRFGEHDRALVWPDVYMGESSGVSAN